MKRVLFSILLLCLFAGQAPAELFTFDYSYVTSTFTSGSNTFVVSINEAIAEGTVSGGTGTAAFHQDKWGNGDFSINMTISDILGPTAKGSGSFTITDIDGDTISGGLSGDWWDGGAALYFTGTLSDVLYTGDDSSFNGYDGSMLMDFGTGPWPGSLFQLSVTSKWFANGGFTSNTGSVIGSVVPAPIAVVLGMLGLGVAGLKLRKFV